MPEFLTQTRFAEFDLPEPVLAGLKDAGFTHCTPIQAQTIPVTLAGKDVAGQAQTGTGKTAAFLVTLLTNLLKAGELPQDRPSALIVAPTRELALQIYADTEVIGGHCGFRLAQVVGGIDYRKQADILREGADIVICTPGRVIDYIKQGILKTDAINTLVIDEADRLFDLGFTRDMRYILKRLPHYDQRQSMLFSATLSFRVLELTYEYMNLPEVITVEQKEVTVDGVEQSLYHLGRKEKLGMLLGILEGEDWSRMLIFVNTKSGVDWLAKKLIGNGYPAEGISGDLHQRKRLKLMEGFKNGSLKILVATDVASRGIHVEDISHVINYDLPQDPENYVHRIGRTARAGKKGRAITFACEDYVLHLEPLEKFLDYKIPVEWPRDEDFKEDQAGPVTASRRRSDYGRPGPERSSSWKSRSGGRNRGKKPSRDQQQPQAETAGQAAPPKEAPKPPAQDKEAPPEEARESQTREKTEPPKETKTDQPPKRSRSRRRAPKPPAQDKEAPKPPAQDREAPESKAEPAESGSAGSAEERKSPQFGGIFGLGKGALTLEDEKRGPAPERKSASAKRRRRRKKKPADKPE